jgi:hypothetical protein
MNLPERYSVFLSLDDSRYVVIEPGTAIDFNLIRTGILFIIAERAAASRRSFRALMEALSSFEGLPPHFLYIANTDESNAQKFFAAIGDGPNGNGETYWIKDGRVIAKLIAYDSDRSAEISELSELLVKPTIA